MGWSLFSASAWLGRIDWWMAQFHRVVAHPLKRIITLMISSQDNTVSDYWVFFFFNYIRQVNSFVTLPQNKPTFRKVFSIYLDWPGQSWHSETIHTIKNKYYSTTVRGGDSPPLPSIPSSTHIEQNVFRRELFGTTRRGRPAMYSVSWARGYYSTECNQQPRED